jgi:hypothetical protein
MAVSLSRLKASKGRSSLLLLLPAMGLFAAAAILGPRYVADLRVLDKTVIPPEGTDGTVRSYATFHPEGATPVPPCLVRWKQGKIYNYTSMSGDNRVELPNGRKLVFNAHQRLEFFLDTVPFQPRAQDHTHELSEAYWRKIQPDATYHAKLCLTESEIIWLEGCVQGDQLVACDNQDDGLLINPGGPKRHRMYTLSRAHGTIGLGMLGAVFLILALNAKIRVSRRLVEDLARWRNIVPGQTAGAIAAVFLFVTLFSLVLWATAFGPWFAFAGAMVIILASLVAAIMRLRVLGAARRLLHEMQTSRLHSRETGTRELAVRIAPDAPTVAGFRPGDQYALVQFQIKEFYKEQLDNKTTTKQRDLAQGSFPRHVQVVDASGPGMLETGHCVLDAEPQMKLQSAELQQPEWLVQVIGQLPRSPTHEEYAVDWRVAQPGDPLLIYGGVERVRPDLVGASVPAQYRQTPELPLIRGSAASPALVHVGDEATLLSSVKMERMTRVAGILILVSALVAGVATFLWMVQQAG